METSLEQQNNTHSRLTKDRRTTTITRQTRRSSKLSMMKQSNEEEKGEGSHSWEVCREKAKPKQTRTVIGKKKGKAVSPAILDVVFGNLQSSVPDAKELCQKRNEDAMKCGRISREIGSAGKIVCFTSEGESPTTDRAIVKDMSDERTHESTRRNEGSIAKQLSRGGSINSRFFFPSPQFPS